jgi:hypothetical protein
LFVSDCALAPGRACLPASLEKDDDVHSAGGALGAFFFILAVFLAGFWILVVSLKAQPAPPAAGAYYRINHGVDGGDGRGLLPEPSGGGSPSGRRQRHARALPPPRAPGHEERPWRRGGGGGGSDLRRAQRWEDLFHLDEPPRARRDNRGAPWKEEEEEEEEEEPPEPEPPDSAAATPGERAKDGYDLTEFLEERRTAEGLGGGYIEFVERPRAAASPTSAAPPSELLTPAPQPGAAATPGRSSKPAPWMAARAKLPLLRPAGPPTEPPAKPAKPAPPPAPPLPPAHMEPSPRWARPPKGTAAAGGRAKGSALSPASLAPKGSSSATGTAVQQQPLHGQAGKPPGQPPRPAAAFRWG